MTDDALHTPAPDDDVSAAEYVLGVTDADERARLAARLETEPDFARRVGRWEARLEDLNGEFAPVAPPAELRQRVLGARGLEAIEQRAGWWSSLAVWRGLAAVATVVALLLVAFELPTGVAPPSEPLVAAIVGEDGADRFVALYDPADRNLRVTPVAATRPADSDFELWLIVGETPVSLGVVAEGGSAGTVPDDLAADMVAGATLAVSVEPLGGAPDGVPTGPVIAVGTVGGI